MNKPKNTNANQLAEIERIVKDLNHHYVALEYAREASNYQYLLIDLANPRNSLLEALNLVAESLKRALRYGLGPTENR